MDDKRHGPLILVLAFLALVMGVLLISWLYDNDEKTLGFVITEDTEGPLVITDETDVETIGPIAENIVMMDMEYNGETILITAEQIERMSKDEVRDLALFLLFAFSYRSTVGGYVDLTIPVAKKLLPEWVREENK